MKEQYKTDTNYCLNNLKEANEQRKKPVAQILDGEIIRVFDYLSEVTEAGFTFGNVAKVCRGERNRHKGFQWKYI